MPDEPDRQHQEDETEQRANGCSSMDTSNDQNEASTASQRRASGSSEHRENTTCACKAAHEGDERVFQDKRRGSEKKNWEKAERVGAKIYICRVTTSRG